MLKPLPKNIDAVFAKSQTALILNSYKQWMGKELIPMGAADPQAALNLFYSPFPVLSSNTDADPILNYGNQAVLNLWEMTWENLTQTPGRLTAEPMERSLRENFLKTVKEKGFIDNYSGIRVSSTGKRFRIRNAAVWNLIDPAGNFKGQAAAFTAWEYL